MLLDPYGRPITSFPSRPDAEQRAAVRVRDQWSSYPSQRLTPERLAGIFKAADSGDVERQAELFEEMEEKDPDLGSVLGTRKLAVQQLEREILPASDSAEDKKIAEAVKKNLDDLGLDDVILDLMDAVGKGFATVEIHWQMQNASAWVTALEWVHQKRWTFREISADYNAPVLKLPRLLTDAEPINGEEVPFGKIVYHRYKARSGFPQRAGLLRTLGFYYLFKNYDVKDWIVFIEKFGQPLRIGKFSPGASPADLEVLRQAIRDLGTDAGVLISDQTVLEILEAKTGSTSIDIYERFYDKVNEAYAKAVLGQTATTQGTPGSLGNEEARAEVRQDLKRADARALAKTLRDQLIWPMVGFNFGWDKPLPDLRFAVEESEDLEKLSRVHQNLVQSGVPIPISFVQKKYGIPEPAAGEPVLAPPQQASQVSGFGFQVARETKKKIIVPL